MEIERLSKNILKIKVKKRVHKDLHGAAQVILIPRGLAHEVVYFLNFVKYIV